MIFLKIYHAFPGKPSVGVRLPPPLRRNLLRRRAQGEDVLVDGFSRQFFPPFWGIWWAFLLEAKNPTKNDQKRMDSTF